MISASTDMDVLRLRVQGLARARLADIGLTNCALSVLLRLEAGDSSPSELAAQERVAPPSLNRTLNVLASAGLIERRRDDDDGRRVRVALTPAGAERIHESRRRDDHWLTERLGGAPGADRAALLAAIAVLERVAAG